VDPKSSPTLAANAGDLTVAEIAAELKRSPNRIRDFIRSGELKAYTFGRELRCTRAALDTFVQAKRDAKPDIAPGRRKGRAKLSDWRKHLDPAV
jgi:excisionase family DNA binding protein